MKKQLFKTGIPLILLALVTLLIGSSCGGGSETQPEDTCNSGISYKLDGNLINFDNALVTGEIHNDAAIGKFYDIWTDENGGFYYHSTITENTETAPFASDWFTTNDVANIIFLNNETNVNVTFTIEQSANAVGDDVKITFSGTYDDVSGVNHTISEGEICTTIDIVN